VAAQKPNSPADVDNRTRLLQAATDAFAEHGFEGASLRAIADGAGVSFQLIAYYFGSKEELWLATVEYLFERYLETGKGLGFQTSGNVFEQFHNHLRLLLTDMLQRPQLRKIWIQEYLADSDRYRNVIKRQIRHLHDNLAMPYYREVVRLGIVKRYTAEELALLWSSLVQNNVVYPYFIEQLLGLPAASAKSVEVQVDLLFKVLTADAEGTLPTDVSLPESESSDQIGDANQNDSGTVVYAWKGSGEAVGRSEPARMKQLEIENRHLKQLVGSLSLEKKILLDLLGERSAPDEQSS
jgi:AcrR family transcriptional regulator